MAAHWITSAVAATLLLLSLSAGVRGREIPPSGTDERDFHPVSGGGCPFPVDTTFPPRVKVNSGSHAQLMTNSVRSRSISPWDYSSNEDNHRYPSVINEARCLHKGCLDSEGNVDFSMDSVPIRQEILVLRREMRGCTPVYRLDKQLVTVGCTCVRPITQYL